MEELEGTGFGFPHFMAFRPREHGFSGIKITNNWIVDNCPNEKIPDANAITKRTGINVRYFYGDEKIVGLAKKASNHFISQMEIIGTARSKCKGLLLSTSGVTHRTMGIAPLLDEYGMEIEDEPVQDLVQRTAIRIAELLNIENPYVYGCNWACSGAAKITQVGIDKCSDVSVSDILKNDGDYLLAICSERIIDILDLADPSTGFLFGDYTSVTAIQRGQTRFEILDAFAGIDGTPGLIKLKEKHAFCLDGARRPQKCITMDNGPEVMKKASNLMLDAVDISLDNIVLSPGNIGELIPHQANARFKRPLNNLWKERAWTTTHLGIQFGVPNIDIDLKNSGNNGSASCWRRIAEREADLKKKIGKIIMCPFVGAGPAFDESCLTYGNIVMRIGKLKQEW